MTKSSFILICLLLGFYFYGNAQCFTCDDVTPDAIFCDDFESADPLSDRYFESGGNIFLEDAVGRDSSRGIRVLWNEGDIGAGGFKKSFGRTPDSYIGRHAVNPTETYADIYWRIDVRHQPGWLGGGPAKLSRAMTLARANWSQGMIAHIWSAGDPYGDYLGMDPASGIDANGNLVSTRYNDWNNLRWLGFKRGNIDMFSTPNSGKWYCIEAHAKLNTPGQSDGVFEFWINDTLQNGTYDLNWHGDWNSDPENFGINAIFIENYWNEGSPVDQERYMDNFVISTERIKCGCRTTNTNAVVFKDDVTVYPNPANDLLFFQVNKDLAIRGYSLAIFNTTSDLLYQSVSMHQVISSYSTKALAPGMYHYRLVTEGQILNGGTFAVLR